jgi:predicted alpha/beta hydrolase
MSDRSTATTNHHRVHGQPCTFEATDGFTLHGHFWCSEDTAPHSTLLINAATGVAARYYSRYAAYLARHGYLVLTYDYRGIGASRPASLRGMHATKHDWGALDCEAALQALHAQAPALPMMAVCHSIGGFALGLAPSATRIQRALFVGCQYAYWQDYRLLVRVPMWLNWHLIMPILTKLFGYFPGKTLRWLEDLPSGVAMEWATRFHPTFHKRYHRLKHAQPPAPANELEARMAALNADILAVADARDPFATMSATKRLLDYFRNCRREFVRIKPRRQGLPRLGHFGFFHDRFRDSLWRQSLIWLDTGQTPWPESLRWPAEPAQ